MMFTLVDFVCPLCNFTIDSSTEKWEARVLLETENPAHLQYAHRKCVDRENGDA